MVRPWTRYSVESFTHGTLVIKGRGRTRVSSSGYHAREQSDPGGESQMEVGVLSSPPPVSFPVPFPSPIDGGDAHDPLGYATSFGYSSETH